MKIRILKSGIAALIALLLILPTVTVLAAGDVVYVNTRRLADNLEYINTITYSSPPGRTESFAIRMTGPGDARPIVMNGDTVYGSFRISRMVSYAESLGLNVLAVVNTDFFSTQTGVPLGIVIEDGVYKSSPSGRSAVCFGYDGSVFFADELTVTISLYNHGNLPDEDNDAGDHGSNAGKTVSVQNFNKFRVDTGGMYLFSEAFSTVSTRTSSPGWFVIFRIIEGTPSVSGTMTLEVAELLDSDGAITIGEGYMALTADWLGGYGEEFEKFAVGDIVTLTATPNDERLINARYATGAGDIIVSDGEKADQDGWDDTLLQRAPRTALGVREDGTVVSYVIDGRDSTHSVGMTLDELADEMLGQGCVYAVNFDGGGSSALSVRMPGGIRAAVVNQPSDGTERSCATYMLFVTDAAPDGEARNLGLSNDGAIVLAGSSVDLNYTATDSGYMRSAVPEDISVTTADPGALFSDGRYTAGSAARTDTLELYSPSTGASGTGEIFVIERPTSIIPSRSGASAQLAAVRLIPGETLELAVTATYYRRSVIAQLSSFTYTVTGDIGEMVEPGVFAAGQDMQQTGIITVSAGGRTAEIHVEIGGFLDMEGHWAREYAEYLAIERIVTGVTPTEYDPERMMSRGDFCLMLYRSAGEPNFSSTGGFDDVPEDIYYSRAVSWARDMGIAIAADGNNFNPTALLSRQDAFVYIYRALDILGKQYTDGTPEDLAGFQDAGMLSDYAVIPTATLVKLGIVEGMDGGLEPLYSFTRAQMAKLVATVLQL